MKKVVKILRGIGYLLAFSLILYPVVSNYINQMNSTTIATDYEQEVSHLSEEQENAMIKQAQDYNESLIGIGSIADPFSESNENQTEDDVYNNLLKMDLLWNQFQSGFHCIPVPARSWHFPVLPTNAKLPVHNL